MLRDVDRPHPLTHTNFLFGFFRHVDLVNVTRLVWENLRCDSKGF